MWPLHPHRDIEVVTYCAGGEFRHADERGKGGVLKKGWVQHTTVGRGMLHSEINNRKDLPMRFIQMWFVPATYGLEPSVEQKQVQREERTDRFLPIVSNSYPDALKIKSDAAVYSCFLKKGKTASHTIKARNGCYLYLLEGGQVRVNDHNVPTLGAAMITDEPSINVTAENDAELLMVEVAIS